MGYPKAGRMGACEMSSIRTCQPGGDRRRAVLAARRLPQNGFSVIICRRVGYALLPLGRNSARRNVSIAVDVHVRHITKGLLWYKPPTKKPGGKNSELTVLVLADSRSM
jgi:hypothetical protein